MIVGIGLLFTQKIWVPKLVNQIILSDKKIPLPTAITEQNGITQEQALSLINNLPEVKDFLARVKQNHGDAHVGISETTYTDNLGVYWTAQVYENLSDHNSTFAWYQVYVKNGKIVKEGQ